MNVHIQLNNERLTNLHRKKYYKDLNRLAIEKKKGIRDYTELRVLN